MIIDGGHSNARVVAERIVAAVAEPFEIEGRRIRISASVGVAVSEPGDCGEASMLQNADAAMFRAKREGGGRLRFHADAESVMS